jgi:hypothetical protein
VFEERLEQREQLCSHEDALQHQSIQQGQAKQHQQYTSLKPTIHAFAGIRRAESNEKQQELVSVNTSSSLKGKIGVQTASLLQLPVVEANQIAAVPPIMQRNSQHISISNPRQNNTSRVSDQQVQHLYSRYDAKDMYW